MSRLSARDLISFLKQLLLPGGTKPRRLLGGISRKLLMSIDPQSQIQRYLGLDEREIASVICHLSSLSRTLIDVGANDGYYTLAFLNSNAAHVIACEPGPVNERLLANAAANGYRLSDRFRLERRIVGKAVGEARLTEILDNYPLPALIKIDVDGDELKVLESANDYPHLNRVSWVVETHTAELENACVDWFHVRRYRTRVINRAWWRKFISEQRPLDHNRWLVAQPAS